MPLTPRQPVHNLAIETSARLGSVAVGRGRDIIAVASFRAELAHAKELLLTIDRLCRDAGIAPTAIGQVFVSGGPGSFTGLRVGITAARTLAWAGGARIVRVPTLDVIAQNALDLENPPADLGVLIDAKRENVFASSFRLEGGRYKRATEAAECNAIDFLGSLPRPCSLVGEGVLFFEQPTASSGVSVLPADLNRARAEVVHRLGIALADAGEFDDPDQLTPIYVRRPEAEEVWERRMAAGEDSR